MSNAAFRRFVYIRMKDNRKPDDFLKLLEFRKTFGVAPFLMASCLLWLHEGDKPFYNVSIGSASDLSEAEQWLVDMICEQGYAISRNNPYPVSAREHKNAISKLGLKTSVKKFGGASLRVLIVADENRFTPYRDAWVKDQEQLEGESKPVDVPEPLDEIITADSVGFVCDFVPATADKTAYHWKQLAEDPDTDTSIIPGTAAYGVVPREGYIVLDMDMPKTEEEDPGWQSLQLSVGRYCSLNFPKTYLVQTPSGGVHAYYKLPAELTGNVKNRVMVGGYHIDLRVDGKGYVIGAGSQTHAGTYSVCDVPNGDSIPELSLALIRWLDQMDCIVKPQTQQKFSPTSTSTTSSTASTAMSPLAQLLQRANNYGGDDSEPPVDMSAVPKGSRNQVLHDWAYGRVINHPENVERIYSDLCERARLSGLPEREVIAMWKSICRQVGI
ncbi:bifunctional DNA primase/polymerase [Alloscardovia omnicolens]